MAALRRLILYGNSGAGKSTLARRLAGRFDLPVLALDGVAWLPGPIRKPLSVCAAEMEAFFKAHSQWIVEGCYGDLIELALPRCTALHFLNPGVETCVAHCRRRPWEPDKFATAAEQDQALDFLIRWVRDYPDREDDCGWRRHRELFRRFAGPKREWTAAPDLDSLGALDLAAP